MTFRRPTRRWRLLASLGLATALGASTATAQTVGRAQSFAIVGGSGISVNGAVSTINGDIGSPGAITGSPTIVPPFSNLGNTSRTTNAVTDLLALYLSAPLAPGTATDIGGNDFSLGGAAGHYGPGRYTNLAAGGVALISTSITLDTPGIYVFTVANQLTAAGNVILGAGVDPCTVFWRTGPGAAQTNINSLLFSGTIVSDGTIALGPNARVTGRALSTATGPVTLAGNNFVGGCSTPFVILVPPTITKAFSPSAAGLGAVSTLTITLGNPNVAPATLTANLVDALPAGVVIAAVPNASSTCSGGSVTAVPGGSAVSLVGNLSILSGVCRVTVDVTAAAAGVYTNTIPVDALQTTIGNNVASAVAILSIGIPVPTLPLWAYIALALALAAAGLQAMRTRSVRLR